MSIRLTVILVLCLVTVPAVSSAQETIAASSDLPEMVNRWAPALSMLVASERLVAREASATAARRRRGDPLWNGALIGFGAGAVVGLIGANACNNDFGCTSSTGTFVALWGGIGAGIGLAVDALLSSQHGVFPPRGRVGDDARVRVSPSVGQRRAAVTASLVY